MLSFLHLDAGGGLAVACRDAAGVTEAVWVVVREVGPPSDVRAAVNVVGPFSHRGVAHRAVPCLSFTPTDMSAPGCVDGIGVYEVQECNLLGIKAASQSVGSWLVSAGVQPSIMLLVAEFLPECPADLA